MKKYFPKDKAELSRLVQNPKIDLKLIDTSVITDMSYLFKDSKRADLADINHWDFSNVLSVKAMFENAILTNEICLNTSKCKDFSYIFNQTNLALDGMGKITTKISLDMKSCEEFRFFMVGVDMDYDNLELKNLNLKKLSESPFFDIYRHSHKSYKDFLLRHANIRKNGEKYQPKNRFELKLLVFCIDDLSLIDTSRIINLSFVFDGSTRSDFSGLKSWELRQVRDTSYMFNNAINLKSLPKLVFSKLKSAEGMFHGCKNLASLDMNITKKPHCFSNYLRNTKRMFKNCTNLRYINKLDLKGVENADEMFMGCLSLKHPRVIFSSDLYSLRDIHTNSSVVFTEPLIRRNTECKIAKTSSYKFIDVVYDRGIFDVYEELCDTNDKIYRAWVVNRRNARSFIRYGKDTLFKDELYDYAKKLLHKGGLIDARYLSLKLKIDIARANTILHHLEYKNFLDIKARKILKKITNLSPRGDGILHIISANKYDFVCKGDSRVLEEIFYNDEYCDEFYEQICKYKTLKISEYKKFYKFEPKNVVAVRLHRDFSGDEYREFLGYYGGGSIPSKLTFEIYTDSRAKDEMIVFKEMKC
ncbi:DUF285 domain-containing protein [Campylobacter sp. RM12651]|uniref:DUF285 domain-containing protein n=1 Tax=Campylobacter sp. RM12651 TaxID=1660079 RepID=UPI001EFB84BC|nr:DUF285 domain-containing protein [Campylobacter sp. RM12651]ULO03938.1 DUF285 domain-containing protein (tandem domains) [Campylobacter sp. RM12651]